MKQRDNTIDIIRGIAIFAMIAANMSAHTFAEPHPYWFRVFGSIAAPIFVFLAGIMVSYTSFHHAHTFSYFLKRGLVIVLIAVCIDVFCWGAVPFVTYDVLYVIGLSLPLGRLFYSVSKVWQIAIIVVIFGLTPVFQNIFGYIKSPVEPTVKDFVESGFEGAVVWKQFLIDGWFPLFPWLGVSLLGMFVGKIRCIYPIEKANGIFSITGLISLINGVVLWIITNPTLLEREGYSELFYPPTLMFFFAFIGGLLVLLGTVYKVRDNKLLNVFSVYGRSSLLMYILHTAFNVYIFNVFFNAYALPMFALLFFCHAIVLWVISYFVQKTKKGKKLPFILSIIFGG